MVNVRAVIPSDTPSWLRMRCALWPEGGQAEHMEDIARYFAREARLPSAAFMAFDPSGLASGFAEVSIRSAAEGCESGWIAYLEGWYVDPRSRRHGAGRALVLAAEAWAQSQGCREFASDAQLDNIGSALAHSALGFTEVERIRCFRKAL
jgi:aminoglycoside 6'-N-acetyltransferase I